MNWKYLSLVIVIILILSVGITYYSTLPSMEQATFILPSRHGDSVNIYHNPWYAFWSNDKAIVKISSNGKESTYYLIKKNGRWYPENSSGEYVLGEW